MKGSSYADSSSGHDRYHTSGEICRQLKLKKFGNAIVDISSPHHRLDNGGEIIVGEDDIRRLLGHVRALNALRGEARSSRSIGPCRMLSNGRTIAKPTSARLSAGPSFVPSPVTATTSRFSVTRLSTMPLTRLYLSCGDERASTRNLGQTSSSFFCEI